MATHTCGRRRLQFCLAKNCLDCFRNEGISTPSGEVLVWQKTAVIVCYASNLYLRSAPLQDKMWARFFWGHKGELKVILSPLQCRALDGKQWPMTHKLCLAVNSQFILNAIVSQGIAQSLYSVLHNVLSKYHFPIASDYQVKDGNGNGVQMIPGLNQTIGESSKKDFGSSLKQNVIFPNRPQGYFNDPFQLFFNLTNWLGTSFAIWFVEVCSHCARLELDSKLNNVTYSDRCMY